MTYVTAYLVAVLVLRRRRPGLVLMLPLILLDCVANLLVGSHSFARTLSSTAWEVREHKFWGWTHVVVDALFGKGHCEAQYLAESQYGSVWKAWWASWALTKPKE